jgi:hypothetical protein
MSIPQIFQLDLQVRGLVGVGRCWYLIQLPMPVWPSDSVDVINLRLNRHLDRKIEQLKLPFAGIVAFGY